MPQKLSAATGLGLLLLQYCHPFLIWKISRSQLSRGPQIFGQIRVKTALSDSCLVVSQFVDLIDCGGFLSGLTSPRASSNCLPSSDRCSCKVLQHSDTQTLRHSDTQLRHSDTQRLGAMSFDSLAEGIIE